MEEQRLGLLSIMADSLERIARSAEAMVIRLDSISESVAMTQPELVSLMVRSFVAAEVEGNR